MKKLEEKNAEIEGTLQKKDEEFKRIDNERMRRFFSARFDDIPASLNNVKNNMNNNIGGGSNNLFGSGNARNQSLDLPSTNNIGDRKGGASQNRLGRGSTNVVGGGSVNQSAIDANQQQSYISLLNNQGSTANA